MRTIVALSALALLFTGGCQNAVESLVETATDGQVKIDSEGKKITVKTDDGEITTEVDEDGEGARAVIKGADGEASVIASGKAVPADFPLPILEGAQVLSSTEMKQNGGTMYNVTIQTDQQPKEAADFYAELLEKKGLKTKLNELKSGKDTMIMVSAQGEKDRVMIQSGRQAKDPKTTVLLHWIVK